MRRKTSYRYRRPKTKMNQGWFWVVGIIALSSWLTWKPDRYIPDAIVPVQTYQQPKKVIAGSTQPIKNLDEQKIDSYASSLSYQGASVSELASLLSRMATTDTQKARAIYTWMAYHIDYDVETYYSGQYRFVRPKEVLKTRKAICSGYAILYQALAEEMGLQSVIIPGAAKGLNYAVGEDSDENHAWNAVKINSAWYLVDVTWGAGIINNRQFQRQFNPHYFATPPEQFIYDHFPSEKTWQLLQPGYNKQQFDSLPEVKPQFFKDGLQLVSHPSHTIQAQGTAEVILQAPEDTIVSARLESGSGLLDKNYTLVQREQDKIIIRTAFPQAGEYELKVFSKKKDRGGLYPQAITYKILAQSGGKAFPRIYSHFTQNNAYLYTPLTKSLPAHQSVYFQINIPNAIEVVVIDGSSRNWINLERQGTMFTGSVKIGASGQAAIAAKFTQGDRYWTLAEYN